MLPFSKLKIAMTRLRFKDDSALRELGLAKLTKTFDAYPIVEDGQKIFVLLPRGLDPAAAQKLDGPEAAKSVVVLTRQGESVAKLWPNAGAPAAAAAPAKAAPAPQEGNAGGIDFEIVEE